MNSTLRSRSRVWLSVSAAGLLLLGGGVLFVVIPGQKAAVSTGAILPWRATVRIEGAEPGLTVPIEIVDGRTYAVLQRTTHVIGAEPWSSHPLSTLASVDVRVGPLADGRYAFVSDLSSREPAQKAIMLQGMVLARDIASDVPMTSSAGWTGEVRICSTAVVLDASIDADGWLRTAAAPREGGDVVVWIRPFGGLGRADLVSGWVWRARYTADGFEEPRIDPAALVVVRYPGGSLPVNGEPDQVYIHAVVAGQIPGGSCGPVVPGLVNEEQHALLLWPGTWDVCAVRETGDGQVLAATARIVVSGGTERVVSLQLP